VSDTMNTLLDFIFSIQWSNLLDFITKIQWSLIVLLVISLFHRQLVALMEGIQRITVRLPNLEISFNIMEAEEILGDLIRDAERLMDDDMREILDKVHRENRTILVKDLFPNGFERKKPKTSDHIRLETLRDLQLIRPVERGKWEGTKHVEIKPFGSILIQRKPDLFLPKHKS
jgi:hypothetical protein